MVFGDANLSFALNLARHRRPTRAKRVGLGCKNVEHGGTEVSSWFGVAVSIILLKRVEMIGEEGMAWYGHVLARITYNHSYCKCKLPDAVAGPEVKH